MRRTLLLTLACSISLLGCGREALRHNPEADVGKCDLVRTVLEEGRAEAPALESTPLVVYLRHPGASWGERFFQNEPACEIRGFVLQQDPAEEAWALFLTPNGTGYAYELQKGEAGGVPVPEATRMPTQRVVPGSGGGWFVFN